MRNLYTTPADFWQERDFGTKISAVFEFIGQHWRPLGKCLLYFVLPTALVLGIGLGVFTNGIYNRFPVPGHASSTLGGPVAMAQPGAGAFLDGAWGLGLAFLGGMLSFIMLVGTVYGYLRARLRLPAPEPVTPAAVWAELRARLGRMLLVLLLLAGAYVAFLTVAFMVVGMVTGLAGGGGSTGGAIGGMVLAFLLLFGLGAYLGVTLSLYLPVLWLEEQTVLEAVGRCFQLIKGKWWATAGLLLVAGLLQGVLAIVFAIPQYAVMLGKVLHLPGLGSDVLGLAAQSIYAVGAMFTYCVPLLALAFQYYNLAERQEGYGLRLLVDQLGQPQAAPTAYSAHYRPDEEGEY